MISAIPSEIIRQYLVDQGIVSMPSSGVWPCFVTSLPDGDNAGDDCIGLFDIEPEKDGRLANNGLVILHYGLEFIIRSASYEDGWRKSDTIATALDDIVNMPVVLDSVTYTTHNATRRSGISALGLEEGTKRRYLFQSKYIITIERN